MCTVTFAKSGGQVVITSNRDEQVSRPSLPPAVYEVNATRLLFPKDPRAGGTWFAASERGSVLVLLNGSSIPHTHQPPYRRSRGLIVLDLLSQESAIEAWHAIDLDRVEPFTIVLYEANLLYQLEWDGGSKIDNALNPSDAHIWSSTTLYPKDVREQRQNWFDAFTRSNPQPSPDELLHFHQYTQSGDSQNGLVVDRQGINLKTLSITQAVVGTQKLTLTHRDLAGNAVYRNGFTLA